MTKSRIFVGTRTTRKLLEQFVYTQDKARQQPMSRCYQMSNNDTSSEFNDFTCEGFCCYAKATRKVAARVGSRGTMFLFLCDNSKPIFSSSLHETNKGSKLEGTSFE
ncbi:MAG TPA: hypothetical protein VIW25_00380 [Nitrososphaeraceae archaeon]